MFFDSHCNVCVTGMTEMHAEHISADSTMHPSK